MSDAVRTAAAPTQSPMRTALAGLIGNVLEWFGVAVYGAFSNDIGRQFFPASDPATQQISAFAGLMLAFAARPVGSLVLGRVGDRIGRRELLTLSIALMGGATLLLGLLPTYAQVGVLAPILLLVCLAIQGFSLGGEFTGSMVYTTEQASPLTRGLISSSTAAGTTIGFILGSGSAWAVNRFLTPDQVGSFGWRIPFIASVVLCVLGWFLRRGITESEAGRKAKSIRPKLWPSLVADRLAILRTFGIVSMTNAAYYLVFTFSVQRRKMLQGGSGAEFLLASTLTLVIVLISKPLGGWLSDKTGRRKLMMTLNAVMVLVIYQAMQMMLFGEGWQFLMGQALMAVPIGMALGLQGAMVVEIFPLRTRVTSMSFAYSVTLAAAGGSAPLVAAKLIEWFGNPMMPAFYMMVYGVVGLLIMWPMPETNTLSLEE